MASNPQVGQHMKPVTKITDRAKRYRAQVTARKRVRKCALCGSTKNLVVDHKDGNEAHGKGKNLRILCSSCNMKEAHKKIRKGTGVPLDRYNPGADSLGQYVSAAAEHERGAHDAGGKILHDTPKAQRSKFAKQIWKIRKKHGNATDRVRNYTEQVKTSDGKTVFINVDESRGKWRAEGYEVMGGKIKRVLRPKVATGETESEAYDNLVMKLEKNPGRKTTASDGFKSVSGVQVPRDKFAYVGDPSLKATWKLPTDTQERAQDALSRFAHTKLPKTARRGVAEKVVAAAKQFGIDPSGFQKKYLGKTNPTRKSKRNLDEIDKAAELAGEFQGRPATEVRETVKGNKMRDDFAHFGWQEQFVFVPPSDVRELDCRAISNYYNDRYEKHSDSARAWREVQEKFDIPLLVYDVEGDKIELVASADKKQLYFLGKNQAGIR